MAESDSASNLNGVHEVMITERLARAVGQFILAFNQLEMYTHVAIGALCDEPTLRMLASRDWQFEQRRALTVRLLGKRVASEQLVQDWNIAWQEAQRLAEHRNHIAHGQLSSSGDSEVSQDDRVGLISIKRAFAGKPDFHKKLVEIEALVAEALTLSERVRGLVSQVIACPWRDELVPRSMVQGSGT